MRLLQTRNFAKVLVNDIIEEADLSRSSFYRHFSSPGALLNSIIDRPVTHLVDLALARFAREGRPSRSDALIDMVCSDIQSWQLLLTGGAKRNVLQGLTAQARARGCEIAPFVRLGLPPITAPRGR